MRTSVFRGRGGGWVNKVAFWLIVMLGLLLAGCAAPDAAPSGGAALPSPTPTRTRVRGPLPTRSPSPVPVCELEGPLLFGAVESLSGPASPYGLSIRQGLELAVEELNETKFIGPQAEFRILFEDDETDEEKAKAAFQKLIHGEKVIALFGPTISRLAFEAMPMAQTASIPVMGTSTTADGITEMGNFVFRNAIPEAALSPNTLYAAQAALDLKRVAIIYSDDDPFTISGFKAMEHAALAQGLEVVAVERFALGDTDFSDQLARIQAAQPDALLISALIEEGIALLIQAHEADLGIPIIASDSFYSADVLNEAGEAAEGLIVGSAWFIDNPLPENQLFVERFREKFDSDPDQFAAQAYTGAWLFARALHESCSRNPVDLRNALSELRLIPTPLGRFSFTVGREPLHPPAVLIVKDGAFTLFEAAN